MLPEGPDLLPPGRPRHGRQEDGDQPRQLRRPLRQPGLVQQPQLQVSVLLNYDLVLAESCFVSLEITRKQGIFFWTES